MNQITKIGLLIFNDEKQILLVKKKGLDFLILPGGKPEPMESDHVCLRREIKEEIGCELLDPIFYFDTFFDTPAGMSTDTQLKLMVFYGTVEGNPIPQAEIEEVVWWDIFNYNDSRLAASLRNQVLPKAAENYPSGPMARARDFKS